MDIQDLNLIGKTYDEIDTIVRNLTSIPKEICWDSLSGYALKGIVPKENTQKFYDVIKFSYELDNEVYTFNEKYKYFRSSNFLTNIFKYNGENIYTYVYKNSRVFLLNSYEQNIHQNIIKVFERMATCFCPCNINLYSIVKDVHDGGRDRSEPLKRNYLALMIVII